MTRATAAAAAILLAVLAAGCGSEKLRSGWQDRPTDARGRIEDWSGTTKTVANGELTVGVLNDAERLYICLRPESRRAAMSLFASGFTIWVGEGHGRLGVRFPREDAGALSARDDMREPWRDSGERAEFPPPKLNVVDLLQADGTPIRGGRLGEVTGVGLSIGESNGLPWAQVTMALAAESGLEVTVGATLGEKITLGLTTPKIDFRSRFGGPGGERRRGGDDGPGGDMGRGPLDGGFPGRGSRGPGHPSPPEPFDLSAKVTLATTPVDRQS